MSLQWKKGLITLDTKWKEVHGHVLYLSSRQKSTFPPDPQFV